MNAQNNNIGNHSLNPQQQSIVSIATLTAVGDLPNLKTQLNIGLDAGLTVNEIKELLIQQNKGFPITVSSILNNKLQSSIPSDDFVWNLSLAYSF